jgi:hypothetical protein
MTSGIPNNNTVLYGPGPFRRVPTGPAAGPPLRGLVLMAFQSFGVGLAMACTYKFGIGDPQMRKYKQFYEDK